ncbi:MAG: hypothetical protein ACTSW7_01325 [Candidatus Thorarchaeota archaeon]|nr:hypothetical protein [Thermoplasmatales archaeon]
MLIRFPRLPVEEITSKKVYKRAKNALQKDLRKLGFFQLNGEENFIKVRKCLPTGLPGLDVISARDVDGVYGLPFGRQIEISGTEDSGKTSLMYHLAAMAQQHGHTVLWIETEDSIDEARARVFGADPEKFLLATPDYLEQTLNIIKKATLLVPTYDSKAYKPNKGLVIFWDSVAATPTKNEFKPKPKNEGEIEFSSKDAIGEMARALSKYQRKIKRNLSKRDVLIIYCNQLKDKIGVSFGEKLTTYGGRALRYHCAIRLRVVYTGKMRSSLVKDKGRLKGITIRIDNKKNKCLPPWSSVDDLEFDFSFGFNKDQALLYGLQNKGLAIKDGTKYVVHSLDTENKLTMKDFEKIVRNQPWLREELMRTINVL